MHDSLPGTLAVPGSGHGAKASGRRHEAIIKTFGAELSRRLGARERSDRETDRRDSVADRIGTHEHIVSAVTRNEERKAVPSEAKTHYTQ